VFPFSSSRLDASIGGRRWQLPIILPALVAGILVSAVAVQSVRAVRIHRRAVETALHDYAAFTTWQYARRVSDYLRLTVVTSFLAANSSGGTIACNSRQRSASDVVGPAARAAARQVERSHMRIGLVPLGDPRDHRFLGYWFQSGPGGDYSRCDATVVTAAQLIGVMNHAASYAPLLPHSGNGALQPDSLVAIQLLAADGAIIGFVGGAVAGLSSSDTLGPDLAGLRVVTTLHPEAVRRLIPGGVPASNAPALFAMLAVTLAMCGVAIVQLRRSQQLVRLRSDFVASVSHELRTPLTQISLFADTLASPRERTADERRRYLSIIGRESRRLGQLVDNILHFAAMTRPNAVRLPAERALLGEEIREAVAAFEVIAAARGVVVGVSIDGEIELPLDRDGFRQLMLNVLDNALKYGPDAGRIVVAASLAGTYARIRIDDNGPGVPVAERHQVFEPFARADRAGTRAGSGIGLAVVRGVVESHGGTVRIGDSPSGGARIEIELPHATVLSAVATIEPAHA
jgi:signal transduction histidine kinase